MREWPGRLPAGVACDRPATPIKNGPEFVLIGVCIQAVGSAQPKHNAAPAGGVLGGAALAPKRFAYLNSAACFWGRFSRAQQVCHGGFSLLSWACSIQPGCIPECSYS